MNRDIFDFWADVPPDAHWHRDDDRTLRLVHHDFELRCFPGPIKGRLKTAPVVLLALSPGFREGDIAFALSLEGQAYTWRSRTGDNDLPSQKEHAGSARWSARIISQFGVEYEDVLSKVAVLNIGAYHSARFNDWHMLTALASSRAALDWAQSVLFPQAERGERVVVCLRSARLWGLWRGEKARGAVYGKSLFVPACTPGGIIHHGDMRDRITEAVQLALR